MMTEAEVTTEEIRFLTIFHGNNMDNFLQVEYVQKEAENDTEAAASRRTADHHRERLAYWRDHKSACSDTEIVPD